MDVDKNIMACLEKYGNCAIQKLQRALRSCEHLDIMDEKMMQVIGSTVGLAADALRNVYVGVSSSAPLLLCSSFGDTEPEEIFLFPPVKTCLIGCLNLRGEQSGLPIELSYHNEAAQGTLFDLGKKSYRIRRFSTRCWKCQSRYLYDMHLDRNTGKYHYYSDKRTYVRVSQEVFWTRDLCALLVESVLHCRATFEGFTTMYKEAFGLNAGWNNHSTAAAFMAHEIEEEVRETSLLRTGFPDDTDLDSILPVVDSMRCSSQYPHQPTAKCRKQGCGVLWAVDGLWKIGFQHCAFVQENTVENVRLVNYPCVCPEQPLRENGEMFCAEHASLARECSIPTKRKQVTSTALQAAALHLQGMTSFLKNTHSGQMTLPNESAGITTPQNEAVYFREPENLPEMSEAAETELLLGVCSKDTGDFRNHPHRSRGYLFIVRACGHIDTFSPIYKSESPSQVFLIVLAWLYITLQSVPYDRWSSVFIAYDAMCKLDALKATKERLPLPAPYDTMWSKVGKVIDTFHLGNHVGHNCHTVYNPKRILEAHPEYTYVNTQACEQTNAWIGRYRFALLKMSKYRQLFFLHRLIKRRNKYLSKIARHSALGGQPGLD